MALRARIVADKARRIARKKEDRPTDAADNGVRDDGCGERARKKFSSRYCPLEGRSVRVAPRRRFVFFFFFFFALTRWIKSRSRYSIAEFFRRRIFISTRVNEMTRLAWKKKIQKHFRGALITNSILAATISRSRRATKGALSAKFGEPRIYGGSYGIQ